MIQALSVYLLAGGESSRMGLDKGLIELHGKPIIGYIIDAVKQLTNDITIITSNDNYKQFKLPIIEDVYKNMGPASGIDTALHDAKNEWVFITSCDMPFVDAMSIKHLVTLCQHHEITLAKNKHQIEPMFACYKKSCKDKWRSMLLQNNYKLSDFINQFDTNFVHADEFLGVNPRLFLNINTPLDLQKANTWMNK
ncbi:MAG: molybdenum cofactor guanylyltransferase [Bacteroidetes bacterium]|nr:molybdenum cofactor guanylyltransferase [Bacteroidota bacterium]